VVLTNSDNSIEISALEKAARSALDKGDTIAAIIATMGTTDAFGLDHLAEVHRVREKLVEDYQLSYRPHIHADAVIGWAWSVFKDYDFSKNQLGFRGRTVRALAAATRQIRNLHLADSVGIDFHKTGYAPYISSLVLFKSRADWQLMMRPAKNMPYLFHSGDYHPGMMTLETSRAATGPLSALGSLLSFGKVGLRTLLGHAVEMAEVLRELLEGHPNLTVLNGEKVGPVTLFRAYPDEIDTFTVKDREAHDASYRKELQLHNAYNRLIFERVHAEALEGNGVAISLTDCYRKTDYDEPIVALKSYVLSPFADESRMHSILHHVLEARKNIDVNELRKSSS
jgi:glutamate/tyrosine decarboxylase-like PLP-dependent enzyme